MMSEAALTTSRSSSYSLPSSAVGFDDVDDDPEILRAALDFIEACEASDTSDESLHSADECASAGSLSPSPEEPAAPPAKPRLVTRNRRKEEIAELRKCVVELEQQLAGTKRKLQWPESLDLFSDDLPLLPLDGDAEIELNGASTDALWSHIARQQQQQRQLAELENVKLRNMVTQQLNVARDLTHAAKRRALVQGHYEQLAPASSAQSLPVAIGGSLSSGSPDLQDESPLLVKIYPSRRVGGVSSSGRALKGLAVNDDASLSRMLDGLSLDETATPIVIGSSPSTTRAVPTTQTTTRMWQPSAMWQSPTSLARALCGARESEPLNLRLLRLAKRTPAHDTNANGDVDARNMREGVSLCSGSASSRALQRASVRITTTCL